MNWLVDKITDFMMPLMGMVLLVLGLFLFVCGAFMIFALLADFVGYYP